MPPPSTRYRSTFPACEGRTCLDCAAVAPGSTRVRVAAHRRWRRLLWSMEPVYGRFDLLIAPSATGPAPRLDAHDPASFRRSPGITTPFDVIRAGADRRGGTPCTRHGRAAPP